MPEVSRAALAFGISVAACATLSFAQSAPDPLPEANPARPTLSTPATLAPVGYLQFEAGTLGATMSPEFSTRLGVNQVAKLAVTPRLEFFVLTEPYVHSRLATQKAVHPGEVFAGAQAVVQHGHDYVPTIAVSYVRRLFESPAPELDLGTFRQSGVLLVSDDLGGCHFDGNLIVAEQTHGGVRRAQSAQTLSTSHPFKRVTLTAEAWHFTQPFLKSNAVGVLGGIAYSARRNLVIDVGFDRGLTGTSTHWEGFAGFTYLLPHRLW
jgi:hypothetical protein